jgi:predicted N-formylglutamate amidohydrolase
VPQALDRLGLEPSVLRRHVGWDIGALELTRLLARRLDAPAAASGYSRLLIDCNRPLGHPTSIPEVSDGIVVPGNRDLSAAQKAERAERYFRPYHDTVSRMLAEFRTQGRVPAVISMHSFTPVLHGFERPWHIGLLWAHDGRIVAPLHDALLRLKPELCIGDNQPYSGRIAGGYTIEAHAHPTGYPHVLIEVRQDLIDTAAGVAEWGALLTAALQVVLDDPGLYHVASA